MSSLAASELGETDLNGLQKCVRDFYLPKAKELHRTRVWTDNVARASGNIVIIPHASIDARGVNPASMWKKAGEFGGNRRW